MSNQIQQQHKTAAAAASCRNDDATAIPRTKYMPPNTKEHAAPGAPKKSAKKRTPQGVLKGRGAIVKQPPKLTPRSDIKVFMPEPRISRFLFGGVGGRTHIYGK